jgi:two-component system, OmpR family, sensor histidine kinase VicK
LLGFALDNDKETTETIADPVKTMNRAWEMCKSAKEEILILFSSANAFARQDRAGAGAMLKELCSKTKTLKIKIVAPKGARIAELRSELRPYNIEVKYIQEFSQTKMTILVVDRSSSLVIELQNDQAENTLEAMGQSIYSTRILTVLSYVSIFESYWTLSQLHEESTNELADTKEYLDKVLTELKASKDRFT